MALIDNIVSYYNFEEASGDLDDKKGSNDGTVSGATREQTGIIDYGYSFITNDYVDLGTTFSSVFDGNFSISFWCKRGSTGDHVIMGNYDASYPGIFNLEFRNSNKLTVYWYNGTNASSDVSSATITDTSNFKHYVITRDGSTLKIYIDGSLDSTHTTNTNDWTNNNMHFGADARQSTRNLNGTLDEIGIWDKALSSSEVSSLYNSGDGFAYPFSDSTTKTKTTNARITVADTTKDKTLNARIQIDDEENVYNLTARVTIQDSLTKDANARITIQDSIDKSTDARIAVPIQKTKDTTARIVVEGTTKNKTLNARINTGSSLKTKNLNARIFIEKNEITKGLNSRICIDKTQINKSCNARVDVDGSFINKTSNARISILNTQISKSLNARVSAATTQLNKTLNANLHVSGLQITKECNAKINTGIKGTTKDIGLRAYISIPDLPTLKTITLSNLSSATFSNIRKYLDNRYFIQDPTSYGTSKRKFIYTREPTYSSRNFEGFPLIILEPTGTTHSFDTINNKLRSWENSVDITIMTSDSSRSKPGRGRQHLEEIVDSLIKTFNTHWVLREYHQAGMSKMILNAGDVDNSEEFGQKIWRQTFTLIFDVYNKQ